MDSNDIDKDDSSSIRYIPHQVDYMRDYFRPKQFVKESKLNQEESTKESTVKENDKQTMYTSIYGGLKDISDNKLNNYEVIQEKSQLRTKEMEDYYQHILQIESKHIDLEKEDIKKSEDVHFEVHHCGCEECSPRFYEDGSMYCALCTMDIPDGQWIDHSRSICHQYKQKQKVHVYVNPYMNPSSNAFQLMTKMGWEEGKGLGIKGQGRLQPIATRLKQNHLGVGAYDPAPLKITHTPHNGDADENEDPKITKERERLIKKFGAKRLKKIIKKYNKKKQEHERRVYEEWIRNEFRLYFCLFYLFCNCLLIFALYSNFLLYGINYMIYK